MVGRPPQKGTNMSLKNWWRKTTEEQHEPRDPWASPVGQELMSRMTVSNPALAAEVQQGRSRHSGLDRSLLEELPDVPDDRPIVFTPATITDYRDWLAGYLAQGGHPTQFRDRPFSPRELAKATGDFYTVGECGAASLDIIVPRGCATWVARWGIASST